VLFIYTNGNNTFHSDRGASVLAGTNHQPRSTWRRPVVLNAVATACEIEMNGQRVLCRPDEEKYSSSIRDGSTCMEGGHLIACSRSGGCDGVRRWMVRIIISLVCWRTAEVEGFCLCIYTAGRQRSTAAVETPRSRDCWPFRRRPWRLLEIVSTFHIPARSIRHSSITYLLLRLHHGAVSPAGRPTTALLDVGSSIQMVVE